MTSAASAARCAPAVASRAASERCHLALRSRSGCREVRLAGLLPLLPPSRLVGLRPRLWPLRPRSSEEASALVGDEAENRTRCGERIGEPWCLSGARGSMADPSE
eukprot:scaffold11810_cov57-Phaeocystis_antarctica.AAC.2